MSGRPTFLLSKRERREADGLVVADDLLLHYAEIYATRFKWKGTPKDMPVGFAEKCLFWTGGVGPVKAFGDWQLIAGAPSLFGIYGQPVEWLPVPAGGAMFRADILKEHRQSKDPLLFELPMSAQIAELCETMARAYNCLNTTIFSMQQPVILQGAVGGEINIRESENNLRLGKLTIPTLDKTGMQAQVLDLGGKDHTQNLISTINALDCEILARMGIKSAGTEKASGVTTEETVSINQELQLINQQDWELRQAWLEIPEIKEKFPDLEILPAPGIDISVWVKDDRNTDKTKTSMPGDSKPGDADSENGRPQEGPEMDGGTA